MNSELYTEDLKRITTSDWINWGKLDNTNILITGATGQIGSCLIDILLYRNKNYNSNIKIYAISRNFDKIAKRFSDHTVVQPDSTGDIVAIMQDICDPIVLDVNFDFIIHAASNTNPKLYSSDPVGTILSNVIGLQNIFNYTVQHPAQRILFTSSVEIYGDSDSIKAFSEQDDGYLNCNTLRAGYPEAKRLCESLCQAYITQYNADAVIARLCAIYGPTAQQSEQKAVFQFLNNALHHEDIVLKSPGLQKRSFCYVVDAASALLTILLSGKNGNAYNIADTESNTTIRNVAEIIATLSNTKVVFDIPEESERKGFSPANMAVMNSDKLRTLGWKAYDSIHSGLEKTFNIIK